jgi:hypothetical protein
LKGPGKAVYLLKWSPDVVMASSILRELPGSL